MISLKIIFFLKKKYFNSRLTNIDQMIHIDPDSLITIYEIKILVIRNLIR